MLTIGQITLLLAAVGLFLAGGLVSLLRPADKTASRAILAAGLLLTLVCVVWHSLFRWRLTGTWLPLEDNFDALLWLASLLAGFVLYIQWRAPVSGLEWFIVPLVILLLLAAGHFGRTHPAPYLPTTYSLLHRVTAFVGMAGFAVAGASGAMYLLARRRLRNKSALPDAPLSSLERLERLTLRSVTLGFALFTFGLVSGFAWLAHEQGHTRLGENWLQSPKVLLGLAVWAVYAIVLHAPIHPRLRGRRAALLSLVGLILTVGSVLTVLVMPGGRG